MNLLSLLKCGTTVSSFPAYMMTLTPRALAFAANSSKKATGLSEFAEVSIKIVLLKHEMIHSLDACGTGH